MGLSIYVPEDTKILHTAYADFVSRQIGRPVHIVQYDDGIPILAVRLFSDGSIYTVPEEADVNIKLSKFDQTFVYNPALGCDESRHTVYFEITYQMAVLAGEISPVIEVIVGDSVSASSSISIVIDRNPIQGDTLKSTSEWKMIREAVTYSKEAIGAAASASASRSAASESASNAKISEEHAKISEENAKTSEELAKTSEENAKEHEDNSLDFAKQSRSYALGDTDYRENEEMDNAKYYYQQARTISESFAGALRPMGTVTFSDFEKLAEPEEGDMYNISDEFATTSDFKEGEGVVVPAGANVYRTADGFWDVLAGTPVTSVNGMRGNVNITEVEKASQDENGNVIAETYVKKSDLLNLIYPVGAIYMSVNAADPGTLFGGTWIAWGTGRVPVGINTNETEFNTVEKTGGSKSNSYTPGGSVGNTTLTVNQIPSHNHSVGAHNHGLNSHTHSFSATTNTATLTGRSGAFAVQGSTVGLSSSGILKTASVSGSVGYAADHKSANGSTYSDTFDINASHSHTVSGTTGAASGSTANSAAFSSGDAGGSGAHNHGFTGTASNISTVQPYITCYMWKRTA